ncbi:hypothetical protein BDP81DRAFT_1903 [Colletotrichum phormii]|uniref:Uncharacterized protein n=1 Tax=Colletotrichum phormii TaxID=359342 RepID=A0AAJ0A2J0_9PEZI|nr:uncharacterized protein BDP81DRAFT_1903 [Colletotrichum phormii]KAK1655284.1 hypothetical protein BDP81DRAFT_1903 [Colletotrichum phormii]
MEAMGRIARVGPTGQGSVVGAAKQGIFICTKMCCPQPTGRRQCAFCLGRSSTGLNANPLCSLASAISHLIIRLVSRHPLARPVTAVLLRRSLARLCSLVVVVVAVVVVHRHLLHPRHLHIPTPKSQAREIARTAQQSTHIPIVQCRLRSIGRVRSRGSTFVHSQTINIQQQGFFLCF